MLFYFSGTRKPDFKNIKKIDYREYWRERGFELRSKLLERENIFFDWIKPCSRVLDIGCGNSRLLYELKIKKDCLVKGLDTSNEVVQNLKGSGIEAEVADIASENFSVNEKYDYIVLSEVVEHLVDPEILLEKIKMQTKYLIVSIPNSAFYRFRCGLMFGGRFFTQWRSHPAEHLRFWSHRDFLDWVSAMGFAVEKHEASNGPFLKNILPNMFGHQICYLLKNNPSR